jgi:hypothetical protein
MSKPGQDISIPWYRGTVRGLPVTIRAGLGTAQLEILAGDRRFLVSVVDIVDECLDQCTAEPSQEGDTDEH